MALKGASEELKDKILNNMSKRASDLLIEEMDYLGPVRLSNVEQTQQQIVDIVRRLEQSEDQLGGAGERKQRGADRRGRHRQGDRAVQGPGHPAEEGRQEAAPARL